MLQRLSDDGRKGETIPLLKPPQDYRLVWRDESIRVDKALHIWLPHPHPGYHLADSITNTC